jgi:hypothetical protein
MGLARGQRRRPRYNPSASLPENKRKQAKANERKIAFICFHLLFRIWTFQWVTSDSNKKIPPPSPVVRSLKSISATFAFSSVEPVEGRVRSGDGQWYSTDFHFCQDSATGILLTTIPSERAPRFVSLVLELIDTSNANCDVSYYVHILFSR